MKTKYIILLKIAFTASIVAFLLIGCSKDTLEQDPDPDPSEEQTEPREVVRLMSCGEVDGPTANFSYNNAGFLTKIAVDHTQGTVNYKQSTSYIYDNENKITKVVDLQSITDLSSNISEKKEEEFLYHYDNEGKVTKVDFPTGDDIIDSHVEVLYDDDDKVIETIRRVIRAVAGSNATTIAESRSPFEYNASGDRIKSDGPKTSTYINASGDQTQSVAGAETYTYDSKGNLIEGIIPYSGGDRHIYHTYDDNESINYIIANSMGITDRISMMAVPTIVDMAARQVGRQSLNYYNPNNILTYKDITNGVVHWNNSWEYTYNEDGYPIAIEHIKRSPTVPSYNATYHYTLTYETITIE